MPVERFRDPDAARRARWAAPDDPRLPRRIASLWATAARLSPSSPKKGVRRFRSIEEADEDRRREVRDRVTRLAESRRTR